MKDDEVRVSTPAQQHIRLPRDPTSGAILVLDSAATHVQDNASYYAINDKAFHVADANVIANTNSRTLLLTTPDTTKRIYLTYSVSSGNLVQYLFYENPTVSNVGTDVTNYNRDRNSATASVLDVNHTPTVSSVGTLISQGYLVTDEHIENNIWILKQNEQYLFRVTNNSGDNASVTIMLDWYEV